jgi:hypothetical protein
VAPAGVKTRSKRKSDELEDIAIVATLSKATDSKAQTVAAASGEETSNPPQASVPDKPEVKRPKYSIKWKDEGIVAVEIDGSAFKLSSRRLAKESDYFRERFDKGTDIVDSDGFPLYIVNKDEVDVEAQDFESLLGLMDDAM